MLGRDLDRWRLDGVGNPVFRKAVNCGGPLCYEYDHILPFSKGGHTVVENCQLLQTRVNRVKSNKIDQDLTYTDLQEARPKVLFTEEMMDIIELGAYGDVAQKKGQTSSIVDNNNRMYAKQ